jgi:hypothetical protein
MFFVSGGTIVAKANRDKSDSPIGPNSVIALGNPSAPSTVLSSVTKNWTSRMIQLKE